MKVSLSSHFTYKRLLQFVMPTVFMMIVSSIYSIVDGFFVSNFVGKNAFAAVNFTMPVLMMVAAVGFMIGTGGSALVAKTLGEGSEKKANEYFSMLIYIVIGFSAVVTVIMFIFMPNILTALGASDIILDDCVLYGRISICSIGFFMLQNAFQSFLVTAQRAKLGLLFSIISGVNNIFFDFLLVYVFSIGIKGAAIATALSEVLGGMIPLLYFASKKNKSLLHLVKTKIYFKALGRACMNGLSEMLTNISLSLVSMVYNFQLMKIAQENGISSYGVIMYVSFIFMAFFFGYAIGVNPITGYNYGAKRSRELKNVLKKSLILTLTAALIITAAAELFAPLIAKVFVGYDDELCSMAAGALRLYSISFLFSGFNIFSSAFFTGLNNGKISAVISFLRTLVIQVIAVIILPKFFGINGIWCAMAVSESVTLLVSFGFLISNKKKYNY
ncbi:MAG: MATE family efflux transporter [Acetobacter sp.]|nr:MATE family efflux transporter [Bacteroides sp.]MCM1341542.1 MATE family efflux transporter [Acetobacter sp.]MCM1433619.1 MATE family efflux transporter [Clostridiales bacterium]